MFIRVLAAIRPRAAVPMDRVRVFRVPQGTFVVFRAGVLHRAPYTANERAANVLIALPERTYANDCTVVELAPSDQVGILPG